MKQDTHPAVHPVVFVDTSCGAEFISTSTLSSSETREINGVKHFVVNVEISSGSHPFYTGKQILVDTARRVEKFQEKMNKQLIASEGKKGKKVKRAESAAKKEAAKAENK